MTMIYIAIAVPVEEIEELSVPSVHVSLMSAPSLLMRVLAELPSQPTILIRRRRIVKCSLMEVAKAIETGFPLLGTVYVDVNPKVS